MGKMRKSRLYFAQILQRARGFGTFYRPDHWRAGWV